jgi:predicted DNA-binding antitoxin AbrB/MazE fold protein
MPDTARVQENGGVMIQQVEAVYENGVPRALAPVALRESQQVTITITGAEVREELLDTDLLERARAEVASMKDRPTIDEVRVLLSTIPGSIAEVVIAERGEY